MTGTAAPVSATFPHPLDGLPVRRTFTREASAVLPTDILADPKHPWLGRQEAKLPRSVLGVVYHSAHVELVTPQGIQRRPFRGPAILPTDDMPVALPAATKAPGRPEEAARVKAWRAANPDKVAAQRQRRAQQRRAARTQLWVAMAAASRSA